MIVNGDFEAGGTGFASEYIYVGSTGTHALWDEGVYAVGYDPGAYHLLWTHYYDHKTNDGTGLMLIVNGSDDGNTS